MDLNNKKITYHSHSPECQINKMGLQYTNKGKMLRSKFNCLGIILQKKYAETYPMTTWPNYTEFKI